MLKLLIISIIIPTYSFAIDYNHCIKYIKEALPGSNLIMDENGKISVTNREQLTSVSENFEEKTIDINKKQNYPDIPNSKQYFSFRVKTNSDNTIDIWQNSNIATESIALYPFPMMNQYQSFSQGLYNQPYFSSQQTISLRIKNDKCYPHTISSTTTTSQTQAMGVGVSVTSPVCRELIEFYRKNPLDKKCTNTDILKNLKKIMNKTSKPSWFSFSDEMLKEVEEHFSKANKLIQDSLDEIKRCDNFGLSDTVLDEDIWEQKTASTQGDLSTEVQGSTEDN